MGKYELTDQGIETINNNMARAKELLETAAQIIHDASDWSPEMQEIWEYIYNSSKDVGDLVDAWQKLVH
jgi:hypothetical protein